MKKESAIAESIGALMLIALLVAVVGIIIVVVVSWYPVWVVPDTSIKMYNESYTHGINTFYIQNTGGQTFKAGTYYLRVYDSAGNELPVGYYPDTDFTPGTTLLYNRTAFPGGEFSGEYGNVQVIYHKPESGELVIEGGAKQSRGTDVLMYQWTPVPTQGGSGLGEQVQVSIFVLGPKGFEVYATTPRDSNFPCSADIFDNLPFKGCQPLPFAPGGTLSLVTSDGAGYLIKGYYTYTSGEISRDVAAAGYQSWTPFSMVPDVPYTSPPLSQPYITYVIEFVEFEPQFKVICKGDGGSGYVTISGYNPVFPEAESDPEFFPGSLSFHFISLSNNIINAWVAPGILSSGEFPTDDVHLIVSGFSGDYPYDLPNTENDNDYDDESDVSYTIYVQFAEIGERKIQGFVKGEGEIRDYDGEDIVARINEDSTNHDLTDDENIYGVGIDQNHIIVGAWLVSGSGYTSYDNALSSGSEVTLLTNAIGKTIYPFDNDIPDYGNDYSILVEFATPSEQVQSKVFNAGDGGTGTIIVTTPYETKTILPGGNYTFYTYPDDEIAFTLEGIGNTITEFSSVEGIKGTAAEVSGGTSLGGVGLLNYSTTITPTEDSSYAVWFGIDNPQVQVWNGGDESITILGVEILPGECHYFPVDDGDPFSFLIDEGTGYRIEDLRELAGTTTDTLFEAISEGTTIEEAVGQNTYSYSPPGGVVTQDYAITVIMEPVYTVQVYRDGPGDVYINGELMPGDQTIFALSGSDILTFTGETSETYLNAWVTNALVEKVEVPQDGDHTIVSEYAGEFSYALPNTGNSITVDDLANSNYTIYVQFYEESGRMIDAFVEGPGVVHDGTTMVSDGEHKTLYNEPIYAIGQNNCPIEYIWLVQATGFTTYEDALAAAQEDGFEISGAAGTTTYPYEITDIPDDGLDYTLVVKYLPPIEYNTIRIFNDGTLGGTITGTTPIDGTVTIQPGESYDFTALKGVDDITIAIDGEEYPIDDFRRMPGLVESADEVFEDGVQITGAIGQTTYSTSESAITGDPVLEDVSYAVSFVGHTVRVYHQGEGGTVMVGGVEIPLGRYVDFPVANDGSFSLDIDGGTDFLISDLKVLEGFISDNPSYVISDGDPVSDAIGESTYPYTINPVTQDYTIVVVIGPMYTIISTACQGGTITPEDTIHYASGEKPSYVIAADGKNRIWEILVDGVPISFNPVNREYTYTFDPLDADHTIHAVFVIHGVRGNYYKDAYIDVFDSAPGHADITRTIRTGSRNGDPIESVSAWNQQIHDHIEFADLTGMHDHNEDWPSTPPSQYGYYPPYTTLENGWPNNVLPKVGRDPPETTYYAELFYVNWTGLMFFPEIGSYTFWTRDDDGMKVFIDGELRTTDARAWVKPNPPDWADYYSFTVNTADIGPGWHEYTIWHYDNYVHAGAYLQYQPPGETPVKPTSTDTYFDELYYQVECYS